MLCICLVIILYGYRVEHTVTLLGAHAEVLYAFGTVQLRYDGGAVEERSWYDRDMLRSRYVPGTVEVRSWYGQVMVLVRSRYAPGMLLVRVRGMLLVWARYGTVEVRSWYSPGTVKVRSRYAPGMVEV